MKRIPALVLVLALMVCASAAPAEGTGGVLTPAENNNAEMGYVAAAEEYEQITVMSHEEFENAELESEVTVETYVQATQSWWDGKITVYAQSEDGAYFIYNMTCSEEDAAKLVPGTKIKVSGYKIGRASCRERV